ncbi:MAG: PilN domain-containing protein, partial [Nitrospiria bacterium]
MIEINLLTPHRAKRFKRKVEIQSQVILAAAVISVTLLICGFFWIRLNDKVDSLNAETTRLSGELAGLQTKVKEVKNYERDKNIVREKIKVIEQLRKNQSVPVHLLDEISKSLPQRAWLISLTEQSGTVDLSGNAITNN